MEEWFGSGCMVGYSGGLGGGRVLWVIEDGKLSESGGCEIRKRWVLS